MAFSGFRQQTIQGLPSIQKTTPELTPEETNVITLLDQLTEKLTLKPERDASEYIDETISFNMLAHPNSLTDVVFFDHAFSFLQEQRQSSIYQAWDKKISEEKTLTPEETLAYSLITNDINRLTAGMIGAMQCYQSYHTEAFKTFKDHITALSYGHTLNRSQNQALRQEILKSLKKLFYKRAEYARQTGSLSFCNLASIQLDELSLSDMYLHWVNLDYANFTKTVFHASLFSQCTLNGANFSHATMLCSLHTQGITFSNCSLNEATLKNTALFLTATGCTFEKANFNSAIINTIFSGCNLKACDFTLARFEKSTRFDDLCLLNESNFSNAILHITLKPNLFNGKLILFNTSELCDTTHLTQRLDALTPCDNLTADEWHQYRIMVASVLLNQLRATNNTRESQSNSINAALEHAVFKSKNPLKWACNHLTSGLGLFPSVTLKTSAETLLEAALQAPLPVIHPRGAS